MPGLYLAGAIVSGRHTSRIFIENGRFHGEAIVNAIVRRREKPADHLGVDRLHEMVVEPGSSARRRSSSWPKPVSAMSATSRRAAGRRASRRATS